MDPVFVFCCSCMSVTDMELLYASFLLLVGKRLHKLHILRKLGDIL